MFVNKPIDFNEFMAQLRQRVKSLNNQGALAFFECFLQESLPDELKRQCVPDWDGIVNAGDFDVFYPLAANILHAAATRNASEHNHATIYQEASVVSQAFCDLLNETFQCSGEEMFDFIPIKSYSQIMAEAGLVKLSSVPDGQTTVSLSEKGERVAREVEREINRREEWN